MASASATTSGSLERGEYQPVAEGATAVQSPGTKYKTMWVTISLIATLLFVAVFAVTVMKHSSQAVSASIRSATTLSDTSTPGVLTSNTPLAALHLEPEEHRHDGNPCEDNEESFLGTCYKTCAALTDGEYPIRGTPFTCCKNTACDEWDQFSEGMFPCTGNAVNGHDGCPHAPGACLVDEEYFLGLCYKQCSILSNGSYPHRSAAATCCKGTGFECLDIFANDWTNASFDVGGGKGDGDNSTPARVHAPLKALTEAKSEPPLHTKGVNLKPHENMTDGNVCEDGEEHFMGLCYKTCSDLTNGDYPVRGTAFSCCKSHPCTLGNQIMGGYVPTPCAHFDVSKRHGCPHAPGACLRDEESFGGLCFAKCELLTKGTFPHRISSVTCCKDTGLSCISPFSDSDESETSMSFDIAGGSGDDDKSTPRNVHRPLTKLTEVAAVA